MRNVSNSPGPVVARSRARDLTVQAEVVTLMIGGSARAREPADDDLPIRSASVRGHLRWWWRILYGARSATVQELREREAAIWGGAAGRGARSMAAGSIAISVDGTSLTVRTRALNNEDGISLERDYGYAAFPLRREAARPAGKLASLEGTFTLRVMATPALPDGAWEEVIGTVHMWTTYGGIGARWRRGFGAVRAIAPVLPSYRPPLSDGASSMTRLQRVEPGQPAGADAPKTVHKELIRRLRDFRQRPGFARDAGNGGHPGRSHWPEPDLARAQFAARGGRLNAHGNRLVHVDKVPRAVFGLPILFDIRGENIGKVTANLPGKERLASSLIVTVVRAGKSFVPAVLVLEQPELHGAVAITRESGPICDLGTAGIRLTPAEAATLQPMLGARSDVVDAFIAYCLTP